MSALATESIDSAVLRVESLTVRYGSARGIEDVTLDVPAGAVTGLLGPNGSGKTTLLRAALDLVHPTSGTVRIGGVDSRSPHSRTQVAYLPGDLSFPSRLSGYQLIRRYSSVLGGLDRSRVEDLATRLRISLDRPVGTLSRGNRQKIGLILAFARDAELLLLDEPTSGLDPLLQREFAALVGESVAAGSAVVLSSHVLSELEDLAHRVAVLREGRLVAVESIESLRLRARQRLRIRFADTQAATSAAGILAGIDAAECRLVDSAVEIGFAGEADPVVKAIAQFTVISVESIGGELDQVLLDFYSDPGQPEGEA